MRLLGVGLALVVVVVVVVAACGDDGGAASKDGPPPIDARPPVDAPDANTLAPVTVTVEQNHLPISGVHVIFSAADSSLVADAFTDTTGTATRVMAPGGFVTAVDPFPTITPSIVAANDLYTVAGVQPGDHLAFTARATLPQSGLMFTLETARVDAASYYNIIYDCFDGALSQLPTLAGGPVFVRKHCTATDLYVVATDAPGNIVATLFHGSLPPPAAGDTVDLTADAYTPARTPTFTYANLPATATSASTAFRLYSPKSLLVGAFGSTGVTAGAGAQTMHLPAIGAFYGIADTTFAGPTNTTYEVEDWGIPDGDYTLDATGLDLPPAFATPPAFDPASQTLVWTPGATSDPGATPSFAIATLSFQRADNLQWHIAAPYAGGQLVLPRLAGFALSVDDSLGVSLKTVVTPGGYDAVRGQLWAQQRLPANFIPDGTTGRTVSANYFTAVPP